MQQHLPYIIVYGAGLLSFLGAKKLKHAVVLQFLDALECL